MGPYSNQSRGKINFFLSKPGNEGEIIIWRYSINRKGQRDGGVRFKEYTRWGGGGVLVVTVVFANGGPGSTSGEQKK